MIDWPLSMLLFLLSLPGIILTVPRLVAFLLPQSEGAIVKRLSLLAILQTCLMTFIMCVGGSAVSKYTGLSDPVLNAMLHHQSFWPLLQANILTALLYSIPIALVFFLLFYGVCGSFLDDKTYQIMRRLHHVVGLDGAILYGSVVEEIISRWGLMNAVVFFSLIFTQGRITDFLIVTAALISGVMLALSQIPAYIVAGCIKSRRFIYLFVSLHLFLSLSFGLIFWRFGLVAAIFAHIIFHSCWYVYDHVKNGSV